jgi:hypothetical protein
MFRKRLEHVGHAAHDDRAVIQASISMYSCATFSPFSCALKARALVISPTAL